MTTTEPTTQAPAWLAALVPDEVRDEGTALLAELDQAIDSLAPLLGRIGKHLAWDERQARVAMKDYTVIAGDEYVDAVDGIGYVVSSASRALHLHNRLAALGFDADEIARQHGPGDEDDT